MLVTLTAPGIRRRMACWLYEGILLFGVIFVAGYLFSTLSQTRHALDNRHFLQAFVFVVVGIYFVWFWSKGQTLAMKTWHIKLVNRQGSPVSQVHALRRYIFSWFWFIPPLALSWAMEWRMEEMAVVTIGWVMGWAVLSRFHPQQQFWHDALAGTYLVSCTPQRNPTP
jgi:uncharacterized RDD family membrane protein YckC